MLASWVRTPEHDTFILVEVVSQRLEVFIIKFLYECVE